MAPPSYPGLVPQPTYQTHGLALPAGVTLSSPGKRFGGMLLTSVLLFASFLVVVGWIGYLIWAIVVWSKSMTPAKQLLNMKVIDAKTLQPATTGKMWMRQVVWPLVLALGYVVTFGILWLVDGFLIFAGDKRQRLLDRMADTYVVDDPTDAWRHRAA